ncbi:FixH family protein [Celeribacter arenosi]|uniref:FixH family protein n=1 Tax=Celeribacter arenosi TaxID=792649 RepID=A0ABP7K1K7_9RHOB
MAQTAKPREITGKHVLIGTVAAFSVIIGVNFFMAFQAVRTFPGLEVKNSYVASQTFDVERDAQEALGWTVRAVPEGDIVRVQIRDAEGAPVQAATLTGTIGRPTSVKDDQTPEFTFDGTDFVANTGALESGNWNYRMVATAADGTEFKQRVIFYVKQQ